MTRGSSSSSSQVGLFSTQISEQIVRLRALAKSQDGPSEAHQVDLRRAVMATRLLAGSARILQLDPLQRFLDELLTWLQVVQNSGRALNTTQSLILDSVVELEESLMLHLDEVENDVGTDLSAFQPQLDELLTLIQHNLSKSGGAPKAEKLDPGAIDRAAGFPQEPTSGPEALAVAVAWFEHAFEVALTDEETAALLTSLEGPLEQLIALRAESLHRATDQRESEPAPVAEGIDPVEVPEEDPVLGAAVAHLREVGSKLGIGVQVRAYGGAALLAPAIHPSVSQILVHLSDDIIASLRSGRSEDDRSPLRVSFEVVARDGRALITVSDDAPRTHGSPVLGDADQLALFAGLRRARPLLEYTQGLIRVEPEGDPDARFVLSVPLDLDRPHYAILELENVRVAVPAALVDEVIDASGLLYDTDESGESVDHAGHSVPIADLAQFVAVLVPAARTSPSIAVLGCVEKRLGLGCQHERVVVEAEELLDPPPGWDAIAYAGLEVDGETLPVLDVRSMLTLRFRGAGDPEISGALLDPLMDTYVPVDEDDVAELEDEPTTPRRTSAEPPRSTKQKAAVAPEPVPTIPAAPMPAPATRIERVLLVNQSEFRRRDLSRALEQLNLDVTVAEDLVVAAERIEQGDIDLLVTDLRLGQAGGESFHSLREKHPELRILLTSSVAQQYAKELAAKTGAHRCWLDPYRASELRGLLAQLDG